MSAKTAERLAQALAVVSFVALCWVAHRALQTRTHCVSSSFLSFVQIGADRMPNCLIENRLSLRSWSKPVTADQQAWLRKLEILEPLKSLFNGKRSRVAVEISPADPKLFELGRGYLRIGSEWLDDSVQSRRALIMGVLSAQFPETYTNQFQLEVMTDFILLSVFGEDRWADETGHEFSLRRDVKFSTAAASFDQYCESPFRSLSHESVCGIDERDDASTANVWGLRPLLAVSLYRVYAKLPMRDQLRMMSAIGSGAKLPTVRTLKTLQADDLVAWMRATLDDHLIALTGNKQEDAVKSTFAELEVETPTHWELTLDVTNTPAWREILDQMRQRARVIKGERVLVFTPEGARALPADLPVAWAADEIRSQKHVLIACQWPRPEETVHIRARHLFAQQSCGKISRPFWD